MIYRAHWSPFSMCESESHTHTEYEDRYKFFSSYKAAREYLGLLEDGTYCSKCQVIESFETPRTKREVIAALSIWGSEFMM